MQNDVPAPVAEVDIDTSGGDQHRVQTEWFSGNRCCSHCCGSEGKWGFPIRKLGYLRGGGAFGRQNFRLDTEEDRSHGILLKTGNFLLFLSCGRLNHVDTIDERGHVITQGGFRDAPT